MKKFLVLGLLVAGIGTAHAACIANGMICYDESRLYFNASPVNVGTLAEMNAHTPAYVGQLFVVTDGLQSGICKSTGTGRGAYVVGSATSSAVLGGLLGHCN